MSTLAKLIIVIHLFDFIYCSLSSRECNQEAFNLWHQKAYESSADNHIDLIHAEALRIKRKDKKLWNVFNLDHTPLSSNFTNGQVMELSAHVCKNLIKGDIYSVAGTHYPTKQIDQKIHDAMCSFHCLTNDDLRIQAMTFTNCTCLELSTANNESTFKRIGDFCYASSGRLLCEERVEWCGVWNCSLEDYQCPRWEYNRKKIPFRGYGWECSRSAIIFPMVVLRNFLAYAVVTLAVLL